MKTKKQTPRLVSSGFIALDIVLGLEDPQTPRFYTGGTTGNVTSALAYLGWATTPISRLAEDEAGEFVRADLKRWGADTTHLMGSSPCPTPIVVEKIFLGKDGAPKHRFLWTCPDCGAYLPSYRPVLTETAESLRASLENACVFFTDRVSRSTLVLAEHFKKNDAVVVFEPSGVGDPALFVEMLQLCDVLKYSDQRAKGFSDLLSDNKAFLEIQTLGAEGLRFMLRGQRRMKSWAALSSYDVDVKDTAGAGDWTTSGLIYRLFAGGRKSLRNLTKAHISEALQYGQALAALNCQFEGARGAMYQLPQSLFFEKLKGLLLKNSASYLSDKHEEVGVGRLMPTKVCPSCTESRTDWSLESRERSVDKLVDTLDQ